MSGFFSDNQSKQKAFDRYYNAMARSDFKQSRALKGLIQQQAMDEAQTDSLATLFQKAMFKGREYEYDNITNKLMKKKPVPVVGESAGKAKVKVKLNKAKNGRFTKATASAALDSDEEMAPAAPKTPSPIKVNLKRGTASPQKKRSPVKNFEPDVEMKSAIPMAGAQRARSPSVSTPPRRKSDPPFPSASYETPPRRRKTGADFSTKPNILSPASMATHKTRVALEDELDAPPPSPPSKYFDDLFGTDGSTANDIAAASEKIDANNDVDSMRELLERLSKERAASKFSKGAKKSTKISSSPIDKSAMMKKIAKALNAKTFNYLNAREKSAAAKKMEAIVEEVSNTPPKNMKTAIETLTTPRKRADKRARKVTPPGNIRTDERGGKFYKQGPQSPNIKRNMYEAFNDADEENSDSFDEEIKSEIAESKYNEKRLKESELLINKKTKPLALHKALKSQYGKEINKLVARRDGISLSGKSGEAYKYFLKEFPVPEKDQNMSKYKDEIDGLLRGIYFVRY